MEQVVYADVLLVVNFIINYLLLLFSGRIAGREIRRKRLMLAALVGAASAFVIFLPLLGFWAMTAYKLLVAVAMVAIGFCYLSALQLARDVFIFFTVSFLLAGICVGIWANTGVRGLLCYNGVTYFQVNLATLAAAVSVAYGVLWLYSTLRRRTAADNGIWQVRITLPGGSRTLPALVDTGNCLREPFTGLPVAVVGVQEMLDLLPEEVARTVLGSPTHSADAAGLRLIPCDTATGAGLLPALRPQEVTLSRGAACYRVENLYLALSPQRVGGADYRMLLPADAVKLAMQTGVRGSVL